MSFYKAILWFLSCSLVSWKKCSSPLFWGFPLFYSPFPSILALHLYVLGDLSGYLSHQGSSGGGRQSCQLWSCYLGVIFSLMQLVRLVQSIECGDERCLLQENSSHHPRRSRSLLLLSFPLSLGFDGVPIILWLSCFPRVSTVLGVCLSFFI